MGVQVLLNWNLGTFCFAYVAGHGWMVFSEVLIMFKHIVMWRFKPEVQREDQLEMKRRLEALLSVVPSLQAIEVGMNVASGEATFDVVLTTVFEDEVGYQAYATDPAHLDVVDFVRSLVCDRAVVDYTF
jgi:hypothetical protein